MTDIIQVADEYYVRASSALADDRTRVLKYGDTFAVFNRYGDIEAFGPSQFGLFHAESRHLSRFTLRLNQQGPLLLSSTVNEDNSFLSVDLTNVDSALNSMASQERAEAVSALLIEWTTIFRMGYSDRRRRRISLQPNVLSQWFRLAS